MSLGLGDANRMPCLRAFAKRAICALPLLLASFVSSAAELHGSVAISSDYVYRGVSSTWGRAAYQGGLHLRIPERWQIGVWASTVETRDNTGTPIEATAFASGAWPVHDDWSLRLGYVRHQYFGHRTLYSFDYDELFATATYQSQLTLSVNVSPNSARYRHQQSPDRGFVTALEATWVQPIFWELSASIGAGYNDVSSLYETSYAYWHVGLLRDIGPLGLGLMFIDTDDHAAYIYGSELTGQRWAATARWRF